MEIKRNKLYDLYLDDDYFTRDDLKIKLNQLDKQIKALESHFKTLHFDHKKLKIEVDNVIDMFNKFPGRYDNSDLEKKFAILREVADCVVIKDNAVEIIFKKPTVK